MSLTGREQDELRQDLDAWAERIATARARPKLDLDGGLVGAAEVAMMTGVPSGTIYSWVRRDKLPEPHARLACGPIWLKAEIEQWLKERAA